MAYGEMTRARIKRRSGGLDGELKWPDDSGRAAMGGNIFIELHKTK
jgi:hypothetical protein